MTLSHHSRWLLLASIGLLLAPVVASAQPDPCAATGSLTVLDLGGDESGIGGTGHSGDESGIGGTGRSAHESGMGGTGHSAAASGVGGTGHYGAGQGVGGRQRDWERKGSTRELSIQTSTVPHASA